MSVFCNPLNVPYRYQFIRDKEAGSISVSREGADPSLIRFKGSYYLFASMTLGFWKSEDLVHWTVHRLPEDLPLYDYAPDVRVIGDHLYLSASSRDTVCDFYRTEDPVSGVFERIPGPFPFWDPNLFQDDDGRVYFYWGCSDRTPIWGVELDPQTMRPVGEKKDLIFAGTEEKGFERLGEDHEPVPGRENDPPYIEGAWMTKHGGRYYLQYACPGTEFNGYCDGVYESDAPLGPFTLARNNPFSYSPGSFCPAAGHGSTLEDAYGNWWHTATMRISVNHMFERRVGLWPAGFDADGELFCSQRFADWPQRVEAGRQDPWRDPEWFLLSYGKKVSASSFAEGYGPENAVDEDIRTWWKPASKKKEEPYTGHDALTLDLGADKDVRAVQINFADDPDNTIPLPAPESFRPVDMPRYIDEGEHRTRWILEGAAERNSPENGHGPEDAPEWFIIEDRSGAETNLPHDLIVREEGLQVRYLRLTVLEVPFGQTPCVSGLRVFGLGDGSLPEKPAFTAVRTSALDMEVTVTSDDPSACAYSILWGHAPDKLYHSCLIHRKKHQRIGALIRSQAYYVRVDAVSESGITKGEIVSVPQS